MTNIRTRDISFNYMKNEINNENVKTILRKAGITHNINEIEIYRKALRHKSFSTNNYELLEFYGDSIIALFVTQYLFHRYSAHYDEGVLTRIKNALVSTKYLVKFSLYFELNKYIMTKNIKFKTSIIEDCFEAFIASLYIDAGSTKTKKFINYCLENLVDYGKLLSNNTNYKDRVLNYFRTNKYNNPTYHLVSELGNNTKTFVVSIRKNGKHLNYGVGKTKKEAEMHASYITLKNYNFISTNFDS